MFQRNDLLHQFNSFRNGATTAFDYFFRHYHSRVYYYLLYKVKNVTIAKELTEKVFKTLFSNYEQIESVDHLLAFLYYFARKCGNRYLEGLPCTDENERLQVPPAAEILGILEDVEIIRNESQVVIQTEIQRLSRQRKKVVEMRYYLQLEVKTISEQLELSPQTVRNHLSQSMFCLRKRLGSRFDAGSFSI